jgi:hypothetical protein
MPSRDRLRGILQIYGLLPVLISNLDPLESSWSAPKNATLRVRISSSGDYGIGPAVEKWKK